MDAAGLDRVAALAAAAPWTALDPSWFSEAGQIDALVALQALRGWVDAQEARLLAALTPGDALQREFVEAEIGCALREAPGTVSAKLFRATELRTRLPATLAALEAGTITTRHVQILVEAVADLPDRLAVAVQARVLPRAGLQTPAAFRAAVARAVLAIDPRGAEERHRAQRADRRVCLRPGADGMAELWALLPADAAAVLMTRLDAEAARVLPGDGRSVDQRRADALVALVALAGEAGEAGRAGDGLAGSTGGLADGAGGLAGGAGGLPREQGRRPAVQVTVAATTLLGLDEAPGELDGYGPISAAMARAIAFDPTGTWRRLLTEPATGRLLDYGRSTYRPPQDLTDLVIARDRTCRFPGCARRARRCHIDHQTPWVAGGSTAAHNCQALCARHHRLKHQGSWPVSGDPGGELSWTTPTGHTYRDPPGQYETGDEPFPV